MYVVCMLVECCDGIKQQDKIAFSHTRLNFRSDRL